MKLSGKQVTALLQDQNLLVQGPSVDVDFDFLHYDSRQVKEKTLFVAKGAFKASYLDDVQGVSGMVASDDFGLDIPLWLVNDTQKALAVLSQAFFDYPEKKLWIGAITGTKGKTTAAYFAYNILKEETNGKTALFSTVNRIVGPKPEDSKKSDLTTPESYELYKDMARAVSKGMTHLVMEVSSQAYLKNRVYGLRYNVGIFLNISPDHIGPNEHPTFADYLAHKEMLLDHSDQVIINAGMDHFDEVYQRAASQHENVWTYNREGATSLLPDLKDTVEFHSDKTELHDSYFTVEDWAKLPEFKELASSYRLNLPGDFNEENATAALMMTALAGAHHSAMKKGLDEVTIPGRMISMSLPGHGVAFVDYAHNFASLNALLAFAKGQSPKGEVIVVLGAPGNKGVSRRLDFAKVLSKQADQVFLTADDPAFEKPEDICQTIADAITNPEVKLHFQMDRIQAIREAINLAGPHDLVVVAGKGEDPYQKVNGVDTPYIGDFQVVKNCKTELEEGKFTV